MLAEEREAKSAPLRRQLRRRALKGALKLRVGPLEMLEHFARHDQITLHGGVRIVKHDADLGDTIGGPCGDCGARSSTG
jgi:hypothetical protein